MIEYAIPVNATMATSGAGNGMNAAIIGMKPNIPKPSQIELSIDILCISFRLISSIAWIHHAWWTPRRAQPRLGD